MDRLGPAGASPLATLPNGQLGAQDENISTGTEGTSYPALAHNAIQEELMALLAQAGIAPNINNWGQVLASIIAIIGQQIGGSLTVSGGFMSGYFFLPTPGGAPIVVNFGNMAFFTGASPISVMLGASFPTAFRGGLVSDGGSGCYSYGIAAGTDNSHISIYRLTAGGTIGGFWLAWGN